MNNFPYAIEPLLAIEAGYANNPSDPGGETYAGIARRSWPSWDGWKTLDAIAPKKQGQKFSQLDNNVKEFYFTNYWLKNNLDKIDNAEIASAALDTVVNHGKGPSLLQQTLQKVGQPVSIDGKLGPDTLAHINATPASVFLPALYTVRKSYYQELVASNPELGKFMSGWLSRIDKWKGAGGGLAALLLLATAAWVYLKKKKFV